LAFGTEHKCGVTDTLDFYWRPRASTAERYDLCERLFMRAFRPPCQRTGAPLGIANGRDAGTCRGGGPLGGLLCVVWRCLVKKS
jgi:hypothetical protein